MLKVIVTLDESGIVTGQKCVGSDCLETDEDILISSFENNLLNTEYFDNTGEFKDIDGNVKYLENKKPKMKKAKKAKKPKG